MTQHKNPIRQALSNAAAVVREAGREARKNYSAEYIHTTVEGVIDNLDERYPQSGRGANKLKIARILLARVFGSGYVDNEWAFLKDLISSIIELKKA